mmetsp:Transcript_85931/g.172014  ORF Transcript_85931/g.172014 Transcript_85931/m.172014 type:complete len:223 (-) Transcript_85931:682-1350(-)
MKGSHLADDAKSQEASLVSKSDTKRGHAEQKMSSACGDGTDTDAKEGTSGVTAFASSSTSLPLESKPLSLDPSSSTSWGQPSSFDLLSLTERRMLAGAVVVSELREQVHQELGFTCSGGIAVNKLLAKLGCGLHKPNQQTLVFPRAVSTLLNGLAIDRLQGLGGGLGEHVKEVLTRELATATAATAAATEVGSPVVTCGLVSSLGAQRLGELFGHDRGPQPQ